MSKRDGERERERDPEWTENEDPIAPKILGSD